MLLGSQAGLADSSSPYVGSIGGNGTKFASACAPVSLPGHIFFVGQHVSASGGPGHPVGCGAGPPRPVHWGWEPGYGLTEAHHCAQDSQACALVATQASIANGIPVYAQTCITGIGRGWESCDYAVVLPKGTAVIEGYVKDRSGNPVAGATLTAVGPARGAATTESDGFYALAVKAGSYKLSVSGGPGGKKLAYLPKTASRTVKAGDVAEANFTTNGIAHSLTIAFSTTAVSDTGTATVAITITDKAFDGTPVAGASIVVEPPVEVGTNGVASGVLCDGSNRLVSPTRLHDGTLLGKHFTRITDSTGEIHLTLYVGTASGSWDVQAYEPGEPGAPLVRQALTVTAAGGSAVLPDALTSLLIAASNGTLTQTSHGLLRNLLEWLGQIDTTIGNLGFVPIYGKDAAGSTNPGVVVFANTPVVRRNLLDYLDGSGDIPPPEDEAVVIDVDNMKQLLVATTLAGHQVANIPYRLPSLKDWSDGTVIQITQADTQAFGNNTHVPIPARGRATFGLLGATGNEDLLYGYGPYPPVPSSTPAALALAHCLG